MSPRSRLGPKPHLGYTHSSLERAAELRSDHDAIARLAGHLDVGAYVIGGDLIVMKKGDPVHYPLFSLDEARALAPAREIVFLGLLQGVGRFGYGISPVTAASLKTCGDYHVTDLRSIAVYGLAAADRGGKGGTALACAPPLLCKLRRVDASDAGRLAPRLPEVQGRTFPAHRPGGNHATGRRRALSARPFATVRADHVVVPRRIYRARRIDRGRRTSRNT